MTLEKEINYLLDFLSESELNMFNRLYPKGVSSIKDKKHALRQIKTTIRTKTEKLTNLKEKCEQLEQTLSEKTKQLSDCLKENENLKTEFVDSKYVPSCNEKDSLFLDALEHAGVDNWNGYGYALDLYEQYKKDAVD